MGTSRVWPGMHARAAIAAAVVVGAAAGAARAQSPFDLARKPGEKMEMWLSEPAPAPSTEPPMLRRLDGYMGDFEGRSLSELLACVAAKTPPRVDAASLKHVCVFRITGSAGERTVDVLRLASGEYLAAERDPAPGQSPRRVVFKRDAFDRLLGAARPYMGMYDGTFDGMAVSAGSVFALPKPIVNGLFAIDERALADRVQGTASIYSASTRVVDEDVISARLPKGMPAATAGRVGIGLLVWIDPSPQGRPPPRLFDVCDELGLACVGIENVGNDRNAVDRMQLALDAVATMERHWPIDPARVYVSGLSGGGKIATLLVQGFPEVFTGAAPFAALSWYEPIPTGEGQTMWTAEFRKPTGKRWELFTHRRVGVVTGDNDFNAKSIHAGVKLYERDHAMVKLFDVPGLGHEMPPAETIGEVIRWIDEPVRTQRQEEQRVRAAELARAGDDPAKLREIVAAHPWTPEAWAAADRLRGKPAAKPAAASPPTPP